MTGRNRTVKKLMMMVGIGLVGLVLQGATNDVAKVKESDIAAKKAKDRALIEALLKKQDLKYTIDDEGDVKLMFELDENRSQVIWIESEIRELDGVRILKIYSAAYRGLVTKPMAMELLTDAYKIGHWGVSKSDKGLHNVLFTVEVPTYLSPKDFEVCCRIVATTADLLERKWSDTDSL